VEAEAPRREIGNSVPVGGSGRVGGRRRRRKEESLFFDVFLVVGGRNAAFSVGSAGSSAIAAQVMRMGTMEMAMGGRRVEKLHLFLLLLLLLCFFSCDENTIVYTYADEDVEIRSK
jgi:hypothetical protein